MGNQEKDNLLKCENCGKELDNTYKFCSVCGTPFAKNNVEVLKDSNKILNYSYFDPIYRNSEEELVEEFIASGLIYEDAKHHNVVFVGKDTNGIPRYAHCRGSVVPFTIWI